MTYKPFNASRNLPDNTWDELSIISGERWSSSSVGTSGIGTITGPALIISGQAFMSNKGQSYVEISVDNGSTWTQINMSVRMSGGLDADNDGANFSTTFESIYTKRSNI